MSARRFDREAGSLAGELPVVEVTEYTDPLCIWSWSSEPRLRALRLRYGAALRWRRVLGLQLGDPATTRPELDDAELAAAYHAGWLEVAAISGAPVGARLAWAHRSTRPASLAAKAAEQQGGDVADRVVRRLRQAAFVHGEPPDTAERIADALAGVPGLDLDRLLADADGPAVAAALARDVEEARQPRAEVVDLRAEGPHPGAARPDGDRLRYAFPTLIVAGAAGSVVLPGWRSPAEHDAALRAVAPGIRPVVELPRDPDELLAHYGSLTGVELATLAGGVPPADAVLLPTRTAPVWLHPREAVALGIERVRVHGHGHAHA